VVLDFTTRQHVVALEKLVERFQPLPRLIGLAQCIDACLEVHNALIRRLLVTLSE
jgi:hypothetical protein